MDRVVAEIRRLRAAVLRLARAVARAKPAEAKKEDSGLFSAGAVQFYAVGLAAFLYFLGWMFLYNYLFSFGIDIFALDIPFYYFFVYSFSAVSFAWAEWWWAILALGVLAPILIALAKALYAATGREHVVIRNASAGVLVLFAIGLTFFLGSRIAEQAALARAEALRFHSQVSYEFTFAKDVTVPQDPFLAALTSFDPARRALPIIETTERYYVLVQPTDPSEDPKYRRSARVIEIARSDILFARVKLPNARQK